MPIDALLSSPSPAGWFLYYCATPASFFKVSPTLKFRKPLFQCLTDHFSFYSFELHFRWIGHTRHSVEYTISCSVSEVQQPQVGLVFGWVTAWLSLVLYSFVLYIQVSRTQFLGGYPILGFSM